MKWGHYQKSGLFGKVVIKGNGDYELFSEIVSQNLEGGSFVWTSSLLVNYRLVETKSEQEVWKENIFSQHTAGGGESAIYAERGRIATEKAVRGNLNQLVKKLSDALSKLSTK